MEEITILFYALTTFFGIEDGRIAAEKTKITIYPKSHQIEIIQEGIFTIIQSEKDSILTLKQWDSVSNWVERKTDFAKELDNFPVKNFTITPSELDFHPHLTLSYINEIDLQVMGVWYNKEKNQFSINYTPKQNIKTKDGKQEGNYWVFDGSKPFSFTIEPFLQMPESNQKNKRSLKELLVNSEEE